MQLRRLLTFAILLAITPRAQAYMIELWDLDRVVENSTLIVEGEVTAAKGGGLDITITHVFRGPALREKDTLHFDAGGYQKTENGNFETGDQLICFLVPDRAYQPTGWRILPGGLKLVAGGKVIEITQRNNPGPAIAELEPEFAQRGQPSEAEFQKILLDSIQNVDTALADIQKFSAAKDGKHLFQMLRDYLAARKERPTENDLVVNAITDSLVSLRDYDALADALTLDHLPNSARLQAGFLNPEGREFLLKTIADGQVDLPKRMACAAALPYQGIIENPPGTFLRDPHYLLRLAQAAAAAEKTPTLAAAIVGHIGGASQPDDLHAALAKLATLYAGTEDDFLRYAIEGALARGDPNAYQKLQPIGGPMVATVRFNPPEAAANAMPRTTRVLLRYDFYFPDHADHIITTQYLLHATDTGKVYEGPIDPTPLDPRRDFNAADRDIVVPREVPSGKYLLSFRLLEAASQESILSAKPIGQSHALEIRLDPP